MAWDIRKPPPLGWKGGGENEKRRQDSPSHKPSRKEAQAPRRVVGLEHVEPRVEVELVERRLAFLRDHFDLLTDWERGFVVNVAGFAWVSAPQVAVIDRMVHKVQRAPR